MTVIEYISEEVRRQGHNIRGLDGIERVGWMLDAWAFALRAQHDMPTIQTAILLASIIERVNNRGGVRRVGVKVGDHICPHPKDLGALLERLWEHRDSMQPLEFYKEFELIHPFVDGNGRTGKVLLNWLNGTLLSPIFPPADIFGDPIQNP